MKAMLLQAPSDLVQTTVDDLTVGAGEVLVEVTHSGVCGTDLKIFRGDIPVQYPRVMGHEMIGKVVTAPTATGLAIGSRVVINPVLSCGQCFYCQAGQENLCPSGFLLGRDKNGGFADHICVPAEAVFPLPSQISNDCAPLIQVMTTCHHAQNLSSINPGETVVVVGHSQGGGQSLVAGGIDDRVTLIASGVPAICDHSGESAGRVNGWPKLVPNGVDGKPDPKVQLAARYVDAVCFATRCKAEAIMSVGFIDAVCPPSSCYAAYNALQGGKSIINEPLMGHAAPKHIQDAFWARILEHAKRIR